MPADRSPPAPRALDALTASVAMAARALARDCGMCVECLGRCRVQTTTGQWTQCGDCGGSGWLRDDGRCAVSDENTCPECGGPLAWHMVERPVGRICPACHPVAPHPAIAALQRRIAELEAEREWRPIETAPRDTLFLGWLLLADGWFAGPGIGWIGVAGRWIRADHPRDTRHPTHWMPMPAPPEAEVPVDEEGYPITMPEGIQIT